MTQLPYAASAYLDGVIQIFVGSAVLRSSKPAAHMMPFWQQGLMIAWVNQLVTCWVSTRVQARWCRIDMGFGPFVLQLIFCRAFRK